MKRTPFVAEIEKPAAQKGKYWDPESHNQPASKHVSYDPNIESSLNYNPKAVNKPAPATTGGSLDYTPPVTNKPAPATTGGSLDYTPPAPATKPAAEVKGTSVEDVKPAEKKAEVKPAETKGTSAEEGKKPAESKKPVEEKKTKGSSVSEKTKTE